MSRIAAVPGLTYRGHHCSSLPSKPTGDTQCNAERHPGATSQSFLKESKLISILRVSNFGQKLKHRGISQDELQIRVGQERKTILMTATQSSGDDKAQQNRIRSLKIG